MALKLDASVTGVDTAGGRAVVTFGDGEAIEADAVIGADGIRSVVRDALFGPQPMSFSGQVTNRMVVDVDALPDAEMLQELARVPVQNIWIGPGKHAITHPMRGQRQFYLGVTIDRGLGRDEAFWARSLTIEELLDELAGWDPNLRTLVSLAPGVTAYGLHDSDPMERWTVGRATLLGDACHAMLPFQAQGAAQAIEDAAVLAAELAGRGSADVESALGRYEARRRPRATRVQGASRANGGTFHLADGPEQQARDAALAQGSGDFASYDWLWAIGEDAAPDAVITV